MGNTLKIVLVMWHDGAKLLSYLIAACIGCAL